MSLEQIWIVPCSGIGKSYGSVAREGAFIVTEDFCPEKASIRALSRLVPEDGDARDDIRKFPCVTIDGCKLSCAEKVVAERGGAGRARFSGSGRIPRP